MLWAQGKIDVYFLVGFDFSVFNNLNLLIRYVIYFSNITVFTSHVIINAIFYKGWCRGLRKQCL